MSRVILLDCDGPLLDLIGATCAELERACARPLWNHVTPLKPEHVTQWDLFSLISDERLRKMARDWWRRPSFWEELRPVPGAKESVAQLRARGWDVVVATSPYESCHGWEAVRREVLHQHFDIHHKDVVFTARKDLLHGACLVDDKQEHVLTSRATRAFLFTLPHNQAATFPSAGPVRRFTWADGIHHLEGLAEGA